MALPPGVGVMPVSCAAHGDAWSTRTRLCPHSAAAPSRAQARRGVVSYERMVRALAAPLCRAHVRIWGHAGGCGRSAALSPGEAASCGTSLCKQLSCARQGSAQLPTAGWSPDANSPLTHVGGGCRVALWPHNPHFPQQRGPYSFPAVAIPGDCPPQPARPWRDSRAVLATPLDGPRRLLRSREACGPVT